MNSQINSLKAANKIYKNASGIYATELQTRNHK